jgi:hypothetical protein
MNVSEIIAHPIGLLYNAQWVKTTAAELWESGLDFGEDEEQGRELYWCEDDHGDYIRVCWNERDDAFPKQGKLMCVLHMFTYPGDEIEHTMMSLEVERIT